MSIGRIKTGIDGSLVSGSAGIGKTIFGLQFLYEDAKNNESGVYVTFGESKKSIILCAKELNMNLINNRRLKSAEKIKKWNKKDRDVYVYFDNDANAYATKNALKLKEILLK